MTHETWDTGRILADLNAGKTLPLSFRVLRALMIVVDVAVRAGTFRRAWIQVSWTQEGIQVKGKTDSATSEKLAQQELGL